MAEEVVRTPVRGRFPVTRRSAMRRETLATAVAKGKPLQKFNQAEINAPDCLYRGIVKLVYKNAQRYKAASRDTFEDLAQECLKNVWLRMHTFEQERGAFSTWVWHVCCSTLNGRYRQDRRHQSRQVFPGDEAIAQIRAPEPLHDEHAVRKVVCGLLEQHPSKARLIHGIFGDPNDPLFQLPSDICAKEVASELGCREEVVSRFLKGPVVAAFAPLRQELQEHRRTR